MSTKNVLSIRISDQDLQIAKEALSACRTALSPYLQALSVSQRKTILKMSDKSEPFVAKVMDYVTSAPEFVPPFIDLEEMRKDWDAQQQLVPLIREMGQLSSNLGDTAMLARSESYSASLSYYHSVKQAAKMNVPGAKIIYEDLRQRFDGQGKKKNEAKTYPPIP
jgi:hypothetical protein